MVCEPKKYKYSSNGLTLGGYLLNDVYYTESLIKERIGLGKQTTLKDPNIIIDMVNGMSKTPFKVNTNVLEYIYKYGIDKKILTDDLSAELKLFLANPYKGFTKKSSKHYRSLISKILMERNVLSIAEVFSRLEKIYFPVRLDFRTRIYCKTDYFDYQQSDLAKGLILFANPGLISRHDLEVIKYFKAYGANMYGHGLDKKSLNQRVK
jgi:DNA-directed RNA polymerase